MKGAKMEITEDEFEAYVSCQMSGVTNMFDVRTVQAITGLDRAKIMLIMKQYGELSEKFPEVAK